MIKFEKTSWQLPSMIKSRDQNIGPPEGHNSLVTRSMSCVPGEKYIILLFRRINTPRDYNFAWELREVFVIIWCITVIFPSCNVEGSIWAWCPQYNVRNLVGCAPGPLTPSLRNGPLSMVHFLSIYLNSNSNWFLISIRWIYLYCSSHTVHVSWQGSASCVDVLLCFISGMLLHKPLLNKANFSWLVKNWKEMRKWLTNIKQSSQQQEWGKKMQVLCWQRDEGDAEKSRVMFRQ